jgi:hypothetical protein
MSRAWYLTMLVPAALIVLSVLSFMRLVDNIEGMQRLVAPGERTLTLERGDYRVFAESESTVDGVAYSNERYSVRCAVTANGEPLKLESTTAKITYSMGGYAGRAIFVFTMPAAGTAQLTCTTEDGKAVVAVGTGVGTSLIAALLTGLFGFFGIFGAFTIVFVLRRRSLKRTAAR